jgi:hypothetical protein
VKPNVSRLVFAATVLAGIVSSLACARVSWIGEREVCGQMRVVDEGQQTLLRNADLLVYRSKSKHTPCCSKADRIANTRTDAEGNFKSGVLEPGRYFIVVENSDPKFVIPVRLEERYEAKTCALNTVFTFDRATGKTEATVTLLLHSPK